MLHSLLRLLVLSRSRRWLRVEPYNNKEKESANHRPETSDPDPSAANSPAAGVLVVRVMADGNFVLLLDVGEEGTLVVDTEGEDSMLVRNGEACAVHSAGFRSEGRLESEAVERREHGEFELQSILAGNLEGNVSVVNVLGDLDAKDLQKIHHQYCQSHR